MARPKPSDGKGLHGGGQLTQSLYVFNAQGVVGFGKQRGDLFISQLGYRPLPCLREGDPSLQMIGQQGEKTRMFQGVGRLLEQRQIPAFAAEAQGVYTAEAMEQGYRSVGESFRRR